MDYNYNSASMHPSASTTPPPASIMMTTTDAHPPHPPISSQHQSISYFTQQAVRAGYITPRCENKLDHIQQQPVSMREAIMREIEKERIREEIIAIMREIEKERIREEIIAEEIARIRREHMMEKHLSDQIREGFPFLEQQSDDVTSVEERISLSRMGRGIGRADVAPFEEWILEIPFHQRSFCD